VSALFALAIEHARNSVEQADRAEVAARVRDAVGTSGLTKADFAKRIGTSASRLSTYLTGQVTPSAAMLVRIERTAETVRAIPAS
jgi:ribosome-binding protein aMBF1 (putative translation factor)